MATRAIAIDSELERLRLAQLAGLAILDTPAEHEFDTIVALAQRLLGCPIALVSLVDEHRQWFKARCGLDATETPRDQAFCAHALYQDDVMVVEDATRDPRFAGNPLVTGAPDIRFYAGAPLRPSSPDFPAGLPAIGTLCVIDVKPRVITAEETRVLRDLAGVVSALLVARASASAALRLSIEAREHANILDRKHRQLHQAERIAGIGSWRFDLTDQTVQWSDQVYAIHGLPIGERPPLSDAYLFYPEPDRARIADLLERAATKGEPFDFENDFITAQGHRRRVRSVGEAEFADGHAVAVIGVFQDITERHAQEQALRETATIDALTGLPNRRGFETRLDGAITAARTGAPLALLILDLDGFKSINDSFGHDAGDDVLRLVGKRLKGRSFANCFTARLGGDEFVMLLTRPRDCADPERFVGAALRELRHGFARDGKRRAISATIGLAAFDESVTSGADLLRRADLALYAAKREERGTGRLFGSSRVIRPLAERPSLSLVSRA